MEVNVLMVNYLRACTDVYINLLPIVMISLVILILGEIFSNLRYVLTLSFRIICCTLNYCKKQIMSTKVLGEMETPTIKLLNTKYVTADDDQDQVLIQTQNKLGIFQTNKVDDKKLCLGDVKGIMEKLVLENETSIFEEEEEEEVSLEEVREAFDLFDENKDGFIDAEEVQKVLCELGFMEASEAECKAMIRTYDKDKDGRINFKEFVEIIAADSFR